MTGRWAPSWFGQGLLTRPSSATAVPDRRRVTWRPSVGRTAGSGDPRRTKGRTAGSGDPRRTKGRTAGAGDPRRTKGRTAGSGDPRRTEPEVPSAKSVIAISNVLVDQGAGSVRTSRPATLRKWLDDASAFSARMRMRIVWGPGGRPRCVQSKGRFRPGPYWSTMPTTR